MSSSSEPSSSILQQLHVVSVKPESVFEDMVDTPPADPVGGPEEGEHQLSRMDNGTCELLLLLAPFLTSKATLPAAELVLDSSSPDEQPPHLISEEKEKPPSSAGGEQTHEITEDRASISSTDLLVSHVVFAVVGNFSVEEQPGCLVMIRNAFQITKFIRCQHKNMLEVFGALSGLHSIIITILETEEHKSPPSSGFRGIPGLLEIIEQ